MEMDKQGRRKEKLRKRIDELGKRIEKAAEYRARVADYEAKLLSEYKTGSISFTEYEKARDSDHEGKTRDEWLDYYEDYIVECKREIEESQKALDKTVTRQKEHSKVNYGLWVAVILAIVGLVFMFGPQMTGFVTSTANITVMNVAPNVTTVTLTPTTAYTNTTLTCTPTTEDWNADSVTSYYRWFTNTSGVDVKLGFVTNTLYHGNYSSNDRIRCQVIGGDGSNRLNSTARNASVTISNLAPIVTTVEITDNGTNFGYVVTPIAGQNASVAIRVAVIDGDCRAENNVTAYICDTTIANECSTSVYNYSKHLEFNRIATGSTCYYVFNGTSRMPQFWRTPGTLRWNLTVIVRDNSTGAALTGRNYTNFTYNSLQAINYRTRIYLGNSSSLVLNKWATNASAINLTNYGNVRLKLSWNVSNATRLGGGGVWGITDDFQLDDDRNYTATGTDNLVRAVNLTGTLKQFNQTSGLQTCDRDNCNNGLYKNFARNETLETYFHIKPPVGLISGAYSSRIWVVTYSA